MTTHEINDGRPYLSGGTEGDTFPGQVPGMQLAPQNPGGDTTFADPFAGYGDYFGFDEREQWFFPDRKQWIEFKKLTEGDRAKYLKATKSDVHLNQKSGEARIPFDQSQDRKQLLLHSITNWHLVHIAPGQPGQPRKVTPIPFTANRTNGGELGQWIDRANPAILMQLEKAIRKANPWMLNEMSAEQIRKEIDDLSELLKAAEDREANEKNS